MSTGIEWVIDALGCDARLLGNLGTVRQVCEEIVADLALHVVGDPLWHQFPAPGGVTGLYLLRESHLTCHTFPELGEATFNLYCCRPRQPWPWRERLMLRLGARHVQMTQIPRGSFVETEGQ